MEGLLSAHLIIAITCFFGKKTSKTHLVNPKQDIMVHTIGFSVFSRGIQIFQITMCCIGGLSSLS